MTNHLPLPPDIETLHWLTMVLLGPKIANPILKTTHLTHREKMDEYRRLLINWLTTKPDPDPDPTD